MKKYIKPLMVAVLMTGALFQSCETTELEIIDNPNALVEGDPQFLLNSIQSSYRGAQVTLNDISSDLTRIDYMFGRNYFANYGDNTLNGVWGSLYSTIIPDLQAIEAAQTPDNDLRMHLAIGKTLQAHLMMQLVDLLGDIIPMSQAGQPDAFPTPELTTDGGASVYNEALALLTEAETLLNAEPSNIGVQDFFYGDINNEGTQTSASNGQWIRLINTLRMRAAITTGDMASFNSIVASGDFIQDTADDFQFNYGTDLTPTNLQHPDYQNDYQTTGASIYKSNWLMNLMDNTNDPRIRYYYYRQNDCTPGASCNPEGDGETLSCSLQGIPAHYLGTPDADIWCFLENGYWGRPHGDDSGTPPDNALITAAGVYPAFGRFDDNSFATITLGQGGNGAGIEPIILASYIDFWRAEVALDAGNATDALTLIQNGLGKSISKVQGFVSADASADTSFEPDAAAITNFVNSISNAFTAGSADDRWNILAEQYFVTLYGGGADAHNFYRRTGFPTTVIRNIDPNPGNYPRTLLYPGNEVSANPNVNQRTNNDDAVFWNTQALPVAN